MGQIASGLSFIHSHGDVHRDLKARNSNQTILSLHSRTHLLVLYSRNGSRWKIIDFGITSQGKSENLLTTVHARGTSSYRAPEPLKEKSVFNNKVDIWSAGCILYKLVVGNMAFTCEGAVREYRHLAALELEKAG